MKKHPHVLFGISGIGNGHTFRQLPLVEHFAKRGRVTIFGHDTSEAYYRKAFRGHRSVRVERVEIPFITGSATGLDFAKAAKEPTNQSSTYLSTNLRAMHEAEKHLGRPDLVISDYELLSAQYAYRYQSPLVTIDQQSKYLVADTPKTLGGFTYADEVARLHLFFPLAAKRIACSFFRVAERANTTDHVELVPPIIKREVQTLVRQPAKEPTLLVYISDARAFVQSPQEVVAALAPLTARLHLFIRATDRPFYEANKQPNWRIYNHGDKRFLSVLASCHGVVSTAGHSLLSECLYLGLPVYAIPVSPYEQHMNASVIGKNGFGLSASALDPAKLKTFLKKLPDYAQHIRDDRHVLIRGVGQDVIIESLENSFLS